MTQSTRRLAVSTKGKGLYEISGQVIAWVRETGMKTGLLTIFIQHTSASLTIQENADPDVMVDLNDHFGRLAPEDDKLYRHTVEGAGRHARAHPGRADGRAANDSGDGWAARSGDLAGHLCVRAPQGKPSKDGR